MVKLEYMLKTSIARMSTPQRAPTYSLYNFTVIARDPNMKVTKFSMGEESMLECHYKFGVYEEARQEPRQTEPEGNFNTDQEFPVF